MRLSRLNRLPKDIHLKVANMNDDESILNMLLADSKFANDEDYFMQLMRKRYPLLIQFKQGESWKDFYIRMIHAISLLREQFEFPYIPVSEFNPITFYDKFKSKYRFEIMTEGLVYAARLGDMNLVDYFLGKGATDVDRALLAAVRGGHMEIVKYLIENGAENLNTALSVASRGGQLDLVKYLIDAGATTLDRALVSAAEEGHVDVVRYLIEQGATAIAPALERARAGKNHAAVKLLESYL